MPVISQAFLSLFSRASHAFAKGVQTPVECVELTMCVAVLSVEPAWTWEVLGYSFGRAWGHRTCTLGKRVQNRGWKNKFPYMAFSSYLCKSIRACVWA